MIVLWDRVWTALIGIALLFFLAYMGGYWFGIIVLIISFLALKEYYSLMKIGGWKPVKLAGYIFLPLALLAVYKTNPALVLALWVFIFVAFALFPVFFYTKVKYWETALSFWGVFYTGGLLSFLVALRQLPAGFYLTLFLFILVWSSDTLSFFVGGFLGRTPLAPRISPHKTWEGTLGGLLGSTLAGVLSAQFFPLDFLNLFDGAMLGLLVGLAGALGDLNQSVLKRSVNVKDTGDLLPGHGGILDRFDSLLFAAPLFYVFVCHLIP